MANPVGGELCNNNHWTITEGHCLARQNAIIVALIKDHIEKHRTYSLRATTPGKLDIICNVEETGQTCFGK
jgi:hypothetical protein